MLSISALQMCSAAGWGKGIVLIVPGSSEASVAPAHDLPVRHQLCAGGRGCCCPTKLRELEQTVQGLPYIAKCAVGDKTAPPNSHLLRVNIDSSTFYKTCTIIRDNQNPSPRALQDLEMSKYSVSSPCGAPKSRDMYRSVLQSISAGLTTKRIFQ